MEKGKGGIEYSFGPSCDLTPHNDVGIPKMSESIPAKNPTLHALGDSAFSSCDPRVSEVPEFKVGTDSPYSSIGAYGLDGLAGAGTGTTETPITGDAVDMSDFNKLKVKLAHKKNVTDPAALAATIGRAKLGKKEFDRRAAKGRKAHDADNSAAGMAMNVAQGVGRGVNQFESGVGDFVKSAGQFAGRLGDAEQPPTMKSQHAIGFPSGKSVETVRGPRQTPVSTTYIHPHPQKGRSDFHSTEVVTAPGNVATRDSAVDDEGSLLAPLGRSLAASAGKHIGNIVSEKVQAYRDKKKLEAEDSIDPSDYEGPTSFATPQHHLEQHGWRDIQAHSDPWTGHSTLYSHPKHGRATITHPRTDRGTHFGEISHWKHTSREGNVTKGTNKESFDKHFKNLE